MWTAQQGGGHLQAKERGLQRSQTCPSLDPRLPSSLQNRETVNVLQICGIGLWQPKQTNSWGYSLLPKGAQDLNVLFHHLHASLPPQMQFSCLSGLCHCRFF